MKIKIIKLNQKEYESLLYLTNGEYIIKTTDMLDLYNKFLGNLTEQIRLENPDYLWFNTI